MEVDVESWREEMNVGVEGGDGGGEVEEFWGGWFGVCLHEEEEEDGEERGERRGVGGIF